MAYIVDHANNTLLNDEPVRKPNAVPPKTQTIKKFSKGGGADTLENDIKKLSSELSEDFITEKRLSRGADPLEAVKYFAKKYDGIDVPIDIKPFVSKNGLTKNEIMVASMNPKEVAELAEGDKDKLRLIRSIKAKANRLSEVKEPMQVASDYDDPNYVIMELMPDISEMFMEEYRSLVRDGYKGTFLDYLKNEIDIKKRTNRSNGGPIKKEFDKRTGMDDMLLSSAMQKISDAMSGIGGVIGRRIMNGGGPINKKPIVPKEINLADYFKAGVRVADLTPAEKEQVNALLKKMLSGTKDN